MCDSENGDFRFLPFEGGVGDQPYMTMQILKLIQLNYRSHISKEREKLMQKQKTTSPARRRGIR